jgi:hypothetical protein
MDLLLPFSVASLIFNAMILARVMVSFFVVCANSIERLLFVAVRPATVLDQLDTVAGASFAIVMAMSCCSSCWSLCAAFAL